MKQIITLLFSITFFSSALFSQPVSKFNFSLARKMNDERLSSKEISLFVQGNVDEIKQKTEELGGFFKYAVAGISAIRIPLNKVNEIAALKSVVRVEDNGLKLQPMNDTMTFVNHVAEVHQGWNLPQGYDGTHVVMGIIDEGIDFTHPDFRDINGNTRIKFLWDQTYGPNSMSPYQYGYGREWIGNQLDTATMTHDGPYSHGSHVTGTACGNGLAVNNYKGVAPNADIIVVKMDVVNLTDDNFLSNLVDAVKYIFDKADSLNEPASINISLGTYFGSHDARDFQAVMIDTIITQQGVGRPGRSITCAAGNAGAAPIHLGYDVTSDTAMTWIQYSNGQMYIELWGDSVNFSNVRFSMGVDRVQPDHVLLANIPFSNIQNNLGAPQAFFLFSPTDSTNRLGKVETSGEYLHGAYLMQFLITPDSTYHASATDTSRYFWRLMTTGSGHFDAWSFDMVFDNLPDSTVLPAITKYKRPDTNQNIASSFTCSDYVITVGSFVNRNHYSNVQFGQTRDTTLTTGALSNFSSHGPTRDGRFKPDISATGEWMLSCGSQTFLNGLVANEPAKVAAGGKHFRSSGTSMASPVVAGIAALYFQRYPTATYADVKNAILSCADEDSFTGFALPDNNWGHGKVNAYSAIYGCSIGINEIDLSGVELFNYPNPFSDQTIIHVDFSSLIKFKKAELKICDMLGKVVMNFSLNENKNDISVSKNNLVAGIYFYSIVIDGKHLKTNKLVVL